MLTARCPPAAGYQLSPRSSRQLPRGGRGGRGGEGGWLRGDGQPSPMPFPCSLRRLVWSAARAGAQGPCAPVQTKALELNTNRGWCDKWGMRVSQGFAMGGIGPVGVIMKPADHRSTGMRHSPRILPLGHMGDLAHVSPLKKQGAANPEVTIVLSPWLLLQSTGTAVLVGSRAVVVHEVVGRNRQDLRTAMEANACLVPDGFGVPITHLAVPARSTNALLLKTFNYSGTLVASTIGERRRALGARRDSWE